MQTYLPEPSQDASSLSRWQIGQRAHRERERLARIQFPDHDDRHVVSEGLFFLGFFHVNSISDLKKYPLVGSHIPILLRLCPLGK